MNAQPYVYRILVKSKQLCYYESHKKLSIGERLMARRTENPFEKAQSDFNRVAAMRPTIGRAAIMSSLANMEREGVAQVRQSVLGNISYARAATSAYETTLRLNADSIVEPPLSTEETASLGTKIEALSVFLIENTGGDAGPTDPNSIDTAGRKG